MLRGGWLSRNGSAGCRWSVPAEHNEHICAKRRQTRGRVYQPLVSHERGEKRARDHPVRRLFLDEIQSFDTKPRQRSVAPNSVGSVQRVSGWPRLWAVRREVAQRASNELVETVRREPGDQRDVVEQIWSAKHVGRVWFENAVDLTEMNACVRDVLGDVVRHGQVETAVGVRVSVALDELGGFDVRILVYVCAHIDSVELTQRAQERRRAVGRSRADFEQPCLGGGERATELVKFGGSVAPLWSGPIEAIGPRLLPRRLHGPQVPRCSRG